MMKSGNCAVIAVLVLLFCLKVRGQYEGDECFTESEVKGMCSYLTQCQSAKDNIKKGIYPTDICGYEGTQVIVCCIPTTKTTTTTGRPTPRRPTPSVKPPTTVNRDPDIGTRPGDKANEMCKVYSQYAYEQVESPTLAITTTFSKTLECPISIQPLIVGGTSAKRGEFPHMVQIGYTLGSDTSWDCGGSLISENFVLTAAHCLKSNVKGDAKLVRGGITNQTDINHLQTRNVIEGIKHPSYKYQKYHDIALLKLDRNFNLDIFLRPACLYTQKTFPVTRATATGWGLTDFAADEGSVALLKVGLEFFTTAKCNNTYRRMINQLNSELPMGIVEDYMVCAGSSEDRKDTCQGDSGGPLQFVHEDTKQIKCMYNIIGVTSFGVACGLAKNLPGVYSRVSYYIKWIEDTVWQD